MTYRPEVQKTGQVSKIPEKVRKKGEKWLKNGSWRLASGSEFCPIEVKIHRQLGPSVAKLPRPPPARGTASRASKSRLMWQKHGNEAKKGRKNAFKGSTDRRNFRRSARNLAHIRGIPRPTTYISTRHARQLLPRHSAPGMNLGYI